MSLTSLLLRVILADTLANIGDDAGAFILLSLVSATQRRRQAPAVVFVADARRQKYEPGFTQHIKRTSYQANVWHQPILLGVGKGNDRVAAYLGYHL